MPPVPHQPDVVNFDAYEVHLPTQELFKHGTRIRLTPQSFRVLQMLLDRPGQLVTREEIRRALWPADTFVDFDQGLNSAIKKIRDALCDSAEAPRYIETLPRLGYRFVHQFNELNRPEVSETRAPSLALVPSVSSTPLTDAGVAPRRNLAVLLCASALCIVLAAFGYLKWRHRPEPSPLTAVPLTALPGWVDFPAISPDGTRVAFEWTGEKEFTAFDLYVKTLGNENLLRLTNDPAVHLAPAWSPDGRQIAFHRVSKEGGGGIYVVPAQGGAVRKLRSTNASFDRSMQISWSPDGKTIAYSDSPFPGGHKRLQLLSLETLQSTAIEHDDKCVEELLPTFSPDGKQLAYACSLASREGEFGLSVVTAEGRAPRMIKETSGWVHGLEWQADGKALLFDNWDQGQGTVLRELNVANGSVRDRFAGLAGGLLGDFSAKAGRLAYFVNSNGNHNIWRADLLHPNAAPVKLISTTRDQFSPKYSPDGKHIVFGSNRGGQFEIWMSDPNGQYIVQLSNLGGVGSGSPTWSPDSRKIAFDSRSKTPTGQIRADIYIVDIVERTPRKLSTDTPGAFVPSWSHDGKWIYFVGGNDGGRIYRVPPQGGKSEVLTTARGYGPLESLDGQTVYFSENSGTDFTLHRASLNPTGTESQVDGLPTLNFLANWDLVPGGVYFFPMDDIMTLKYFDFSTRKARPILKVTGGPSAGLSVSPDGRYILYGEFDDYRSEIMLVENFH